MEQHLFQDFDIIDDHDFKRSDSGSDSGLSGNGVSVHPIPVSDAQGGDGEMSIGALPAPAVPDNQETNNIATLINETVTYAIDKNNTQSVTCEIDEDEFFVMTINKPYVRQDSDHERSAALGIQPVAESGAHNNPHSEPEPKSYECTELSPTDEDYHRTLRQQGTETETETELINSYVII